MKREINSIIEKIRKEISFFAGALEIIEVSQNSLKRDRYCKKHKMSYPQFLKAYQQVKNELMLYPVVVNCMEVVIKQKKKTEKEYEVLKNNVLDILKQLIEKVKKQEQGSKINDMQNLLDDLKKDKKNDG